MKSDAERLALCESREVIYLDAIAKLADQCVELQGAIRGLKLSLTEFRDHVSQNAVTWAPGTGSHHHPIWSKVAAALDAADGHRIGWLPIQSAPRDRTRVLLCFRTDLPERVEHFSGVPFVGRYGGELELWGFAAPVGMGGFTDEWLLGWRPIGAFSAAAADGEQHPDDIAVDRFAVAMKAKLAKKRSEGRAGWDDEEFCPIAWLKQQMQRHSFKGDPVDVGNFAMMIWNRLAADKGDIVAVDHESKPVHELCTDCPPIGYPTNKTRCNGCPRGAGPEAL